MLIRLTDGDHFTIYTNIKSLYCIPGTNIMLYGNYTSIKKEMTISVLMKIDVKSVPEG